MATPLDDSLYGTRNKRGDWTPSKPIEYPPVFTWPARPIQFLRWFFGFPGFLMPWNFLYAAITIVVWLYMTPSMQTVSTFAPGWIAAVFLRNAAITLVFFGALHGYLYIQQRQAGAFKFNAKWPSTENPAFLFKRQLADNMIWTFASGVTIWTAYEVVTLWAYAHGYIPYLDVAAHPVYTAVLMLLIPPFRNLHFYLVHRALHWPPLYKWVHSLHHNNTNPSPFSGLAMHPVEHLFYFSGVLLHWVVPSHPVHAMFHLMHAGLSPAPGHAGFERIVVGPETGPSVVIATDSFAHYLHHKYFECNYADGVIPLDKWFGSFHDGTPEAQERMTRRLRERARRRAEREARSQPGIG